MSQAGLLDIESSHPQIPTSFTTDSGTAIPIANDQELLGGDGISTSASGKTITFSLDNPVSVALGGTGVASIDSGSLILGNGTGAVSTVSLTDGQVLIGDTTGVTPVAAQLTAGTGVSILNSAGGIRISASSSVAIDFAADSGTASSALNVVTLAGGTGLTSSASGSTITFDLDTPVDVTLGGTGATSLTDGGILLGSGTGAVTALGQATDGQIPIGSTGLDPVLATITAGSGISVTNAAGSITVTNTGGSFSWSTVTGATQALSAQNGYVGNRATSITYTLPATANVGDTIRITNIGVGLPIIAQNASQLINFGASTTTTGVGGSLTGIEQFCSIELVCVVTNTTFNVLESVGNFTVV